MTLLQALCDLRAGLAFEDAPAGHALVNEQALCEDSPAGHSGWIFTGSRARTAIRLLFASFVRRSLATRCQEQHWFRLSLLWSVQPCRLQSFQRCISRSILLRALHSSSSSVRIGECRSNKLAGCKSAFEKTHSALTSLRPGASSFCSV